jgi:endoglucanase
MSRTSLFLSLAMVACAPAHDYCRKKPEAPPPPPLLGPSSQVQQQAPADFLRVSGGQIVDGMGRPVRLRGVAFGNQVWSDVAEPRRHHTETDYQRIRDMGMNAVRFYLNAITFEDTRAPGGYKQSGWAWLADNINWAKKHGVYLVLNLHVPPGGYQSLGKGGELWTNRDAQRRFIDLWTAIAQHYHQEPAIAGYDLLNEPVVTESIDQWKTLAEQAIAAIRTVDPWHMMFVERVNAVGSDWTENAERNFFLVKDPNVVYEFHFYKPFHFTHQGAPWVELAAAETRYPNPDGVGIEWFNTDWRASTFNSPRLPAGDSDWRFYQGASLTVTDPQHVIGRPVLGCSGNSGKAWFDDLVLEELDAKSRVKHTIWKQNLNTKRGWYLWSNDGSGAFSRESTGHGDDSSLAITGTKSDANLSAEFLQIRVEPKHTYRLSGWMKGQAIPTAAQCQIRIDLYSARAPIFPIDRSFLAYELDAYVNWGKAHHVPLFLGEFGVIRQAFDGDRGGLRWVADMLDLIESRQLNFTFHDYHEENMGIFYGDNSLPDPAHANQPLIDLFRSKLTQTAGP